MALFFDSEWFEARLKEKNKNKESFAEALGVSTKTMALVWKDQHTLTPEQISKAADFFSQTREVIINYAGIAVEKKPRAENNKNDNQLNEIIIRLDKIEHSLADLKNMIFAKGISN